MEDQSERQRIAELELQQARYDASLAERRYAACDPDKRLIAAQFEKSWEAARCDVWRHARRGWKRCEDRTRSLSCRISPD